MESGKEKGKGKNRKKGRAGKGDGKEGKIEEDGKEEKEKVGEEKRKRGGHPSWGTLPFGAKKNGRPWLHLEITNVSIFTLHYAFLTWPK